MKKPLIIYLRVSMYLLLLPLLFSFSCLNQDREDEPIPADLFSKWHLVVIGYTDKADLKPPQDTHVWIEFSKWQPTSSQKPAHGYTYWFNGQAAPNHYSGSFNLTGEGSKGTILFGELTATEVASTRMANTAFEVEYFGLLPKAKSYTIQNNTLTILCQDGEKLVYNKQSS